jgi:hypothetical protein
MTPMPYCGHKLSQNGFVAMQMKSKNIIQQAEITGIIEI